MKKLFFKLSFVWLSVSILSACGSPVNSSSEETNITKELLAENKAEVEMEVEGMVCAKGCAKFIEDKVLDLEGVVASNVNFEEGIAHFEFDKTSLTQEEIQEYINSIHEGQYKATIAQDENDSEIEDEGSGKEGEVISSVKERINTTIPQLFTYFIKRIR